MNNHNQCLIKYFLPDMLICNVILHLKGLKLGSVKVYNCNVANKVMKQAPTNCCGSFLHK